MFGLDYISESVQVVKAMGAKFVCRYVGYFSGYDVNDVQRQQGKCLYTAEANLLLSNDVDIVSNFEWYAMRPSIHDAGTSAAAFAAGQWDTRIAQAIHAGCGGPVTAPIYFSVDYQTDGSDTVDYFEGVASVIGLSRVGAYGGYDCIKFLFDKGLITYGWQTYAWSRGLWDSRAHIHQYSNGNKTIDGGQVDFDDSVKTNFGSWRTYAMAVPKGPFTTYTFGKEIPSNVSWQDLPAQYGIGKDDLLAIPGNSVFAPYDTNPASVQGMKINLPGYTQSSQVSDPKAVAAKTALQAWLAEP